MVRLVFSVVRKGVRHARQPVEADFAVGLGIVDRLEQISALRCMSNRGDASSPEDADLELAHPHVDARQNRTDITAEFGDERAVHSSPSSIQSRSSFPANSLRIQQLQCAQHHAPIALATASAASIPLFIAVWLPLMRGTFTKPAAQPTSAPPGNASLGTDCQPPSLMTRAP